MEYVPTPDANNAALEWTAAERQEACLRARLWNRPLTSLGRRCDAWSIAWPDAVAALDLGAKVPCDPVRVLRVHRRRCLVRFVRERMRVRLSERHVCVCAIQRVPPSIHAPARRTEFRLTSRLGKVNNRRCGRQK